MRLFINIIIMTMQVMCIEIYIMPYERNYSFYKNIYTHYTHMMQINFYIAKMVKNLRDVSNLN